VPVELFSATGFGSAPRLNYLLYSCSEPPTGNDCGRAK